MLPIQTPLTTVIIVTFNRLSYLKLTIDTVLNQTFKDIEILVIGDGHQVEVETYIKELGHQSLKYLYVPHCGYPAKARNLGLKIAQGKYIAFCDDDDLWHPEKLEKQFKIINGNSGRGLCFTDRFIIDSEGEINTSSDKKIKWFPKKPSTENLFFSNYISYSSVLIDKTSIKGTEFPDDLKFRAVEDYHFWLRISQSTNLFFLNEKLVYYRVHNSNITNKLSTGASLNLRVFQDFSSNYKFNAFQIFKAKSIAFLKFSFYKILEIKNDK
jgi:glycosyltransferase involved in cell wall biosynthesis